VLGAEHARTQKIRRGLDKVRNIEATEVTETHRAYYSQLSVGHRAARGVREATAHEQESPRTRSDSCSHAVPPRHAGRRPAPDRFHGTGNADVF
jgi:hypothetical protein